MCPPWAIWNVGPCGDVSLPKSSIWLSNYAFLSQRVVSFIPNIFMLFPAFETESPKRNCALLFQNFLAFVLTTFLSLQKETAPSFSRNFLLLSLAAFLWLLGSFPFLSDFFCHRFSASFTLASWLAQCAPWHGKLIFK